MMDELLNALSLWLVIFCIGYGCYLALKRLWRKAFGEPKRRVRAHSFKRMMAQNVTVIADNENIGATISVADFGEVYLGGRPDMVWSTAEGLLVPVEFRSRRSLDIRQSDVDQLSLQAWVLRLNGHQTAEIGVLVFDKRSLFGHSSRPVYLLSDEACDTLVRRYLEILHGRRSSSKAADHRCRTCAHIRDCRPFASWFSR